MGPTPVVRIAPCAQHQAPGFDFVEINESDFNPEIHTLYAEQQQKPSDGLTVEQLKAALAAKNVTVPQEVTKKADLAALLDAQHTE